MLVRLKLDFEKSDWSQRLIGSIGIAARSYFLVALNIFTSPRSFSNDLHVTRKLSLHCVYNASSVVKASGGDLARVKWAKCNQTHCLGNGVNLLVLCGVFSVQCVILFCKNAAQFNRLKLLPLIISKPRLGQVFSRQQLIPKPFSSLASHLLGCDTRTTRTHTCTHPTHTGGHGCSCQFCLLTARTLIDDLHF